MAAAQPFRVELSRQATRVFERLPAVDQARGAKALDALEREPRPRGKQVKAIQGTRDAFLRYRVGDYGCCTRSSTPNASCSWPAS
jgi:mRNA-degrading endonuclease RelE of RelBE toxin-antitoxin system